MHLTRAGFNFVVAVYLAPLVLVDLVGNTNATGVWSDVYYFKCIFDAALVAYAIYQMTRPTTAHVTTARAQVADKSDDVVSFENLGAIEYIYCGLLVLYALGNWFFLHNINANSTGLLSISTLVWSIFSFIVAVLAGIQFWHLKSGAIVELKKKALQ